MFLEKGDLITETKLLKDIALTGQDDLNDMKKEKTKELLKYKRPLEALNNEQKELDEVRHTRVTVVEWLGYTLV